MEMISQRYYTTPEGKEQGSKEADTVCQGQGLTPEQLGILLKVASGRMGKDPVRLKQELTDGSYDRVLESLGADQEKLRAMMENRSAMEELLGSPQVKTILRELLGRGQPEE